jgi:hypothetical protein
MIAPDVGFPGVFIVGSSLERGGILGVHGEVVELPVSRLHVVKLLRRRNISAQTFMLSVV